MMNSVEKHSKEVLLKLNSFRATDMLCDVTVVGDEGTFRMTAHRCLLAANSEYFKVMFASSFRETTEGEVIIDHLSSSVLEQLIEYCYTSELEVDDTNIVEVFEAASYLQMDSLLVILTNYTLENLNIKNCWDYRSLGDRLHYTNLLKVAETFICANFEEASDAPGFLELNADQLASYIDSLHVNIPSEEYLFLTLNNWMMHDRLNREQFLPTLLSLIPMTNISSQFLLKHIEPVCTTVETSKILFSALKYCHLSNEYPSPNHDPDRALRLLAVTALYHQPIIFEFNNERCKWTVFSHQIVNNVFGRLGAAHCRGFLYFTCWNNGTLNELVQLHIATKTWKTFLVFPTAICCAKPVALYGMIYIVGQDNGQTKVRRFNPITEEMCDVATLLGYGCCEALTALDGRLYISRYNNEIDVYDPATDEWSSIPMRRARNSYAVTLFGHGDELIIMGGGTNEVERCNLNTGHTKISIVDQSEGITCCVQIHNKLVAFGPRNVIESDDTRTWNPSPIRSLPNKCEVFAIPSKYFVTPEKAM